MPCACQVVLGPHGRMLYCGLRRRADGSCALADVFDGDGLRLRELSGNPAEALLEAMGDTSPQTILRLQRIAQQEVLAP